MRSARTHDLDVSTLYRILALRARVFVVEQQCVYLDTDGRDLEPGAMQVWVDGDDGAGSTVLATLRVLDEGHDFRIGRVATDERARGRGLAAAMMARALWLTSARGVVLDAQSHLADWYGRFGFTVDGPEFIEDGIPHVPMRLPQQLSARTDLS